MEITFPRWMLGPLRRALFSFEQFSRHEMANHASAGAYAFLLSAFPAILIVLYGFSTLGKWLGWELAWVVSILSPYLEAFGGTELFIDLLARPLSGWAGFLGFINLLWTSRLLILSIQRGIRVIYSSPSRESAFRENLLTIVIELVSLVALIVILGMGQILKLFFQSTGWFPMRRILSGLVSLGIASLGPLSLWLFTFLTYLKIPAQKPSVKHALITSILCLGSYIGMSFLLGIILNTDRYGLLYGILGNLIGALIRVYMFFWFYFFFAELCYTLENYDSLLFARFHRIDTSGKTPKTLERNLFSKPQRLFKKYAREFPAGSTIFKKGDPCGEAYYLYKGKVAVFIEDPSAGGKPISVLKEGEFFGEMACILKEPRTAWAIAQTDTTVFVLPSAMFKGLLNQDPHAATRMVELLAARLSANNAQFRMIKPLEKQNYQS
ncbi:MAG: YihY/virulence factor BrkB family protein [Spirochaetes bacterium]|nr:YihY/virulence factor BrkB family protein [Spirochaetota bacterium]